MEENHQERSSIERFITIDKQVSATAREAIDNSVVEFIIASNQSFSLVENPFFRKLCFTLNRGYTLHSRRELVRKIDTKIDKLKEKLSVEIQDDIKSHRSVHITSDEGNSGGLNKTHKNTVTVTRISDDWQMKTDTIAVPEAIGSQTGIVLRTQWKEELEKVGYDGSWKVSATTDAAKNVRSARAVGRHDEVGLKIKYEADCVDHQIQLLIKDSRKNNICLKESLKESRKLIKHFGMSSLSRQLFVTIQKEKKLPVKSKPPSGHLGQDKRSLLLKRKLESINSQQMNTFESRVDKEINRYIDFKI